jgi:hypothetical protein
MRFIEIDGKRYAWREILQKRREQINHARQPQPTLFELKEDHRPRTQTTAAGRFQQPLLFEERQP